MKLSFDARKMILSIIPDTEIDEMHVENIADELTYSNAEVRICNEGGKVVIKVHVGNQETI